MTRKYFEELNKDILKVAGKCDLLEVQLRGLAHERFDTSFHKLTFDQQECTRAALFHLISRIRPIIEHYDQYTEDRLWNAVRKKYQEENPND